MLTDRGACSELDNPEPAWLDGLHTLHIPFYSFVGEPLATTATTLAHWASARDIAVSVDTSSSAVLEQVGPPVAIDIIRALRPTIVLANELEAATLGTGLHPDNLGGALVVVKQGPLPAIVLQSGQPPHEVSANVLANVTDTTGAGDAFAAGFLLAFAADADPIGAARHGHQVAAAAIQRASA
jgi:sugar/nucleoside kinase (ribokinase family)